MRRQEIIEEVATEFMLLRMQMHVLELKKYYKQHKLEIEKSFLDKVKHGLQQCMEQRKKMGYVTVSILESSLLTEKYDLQIAFYDKNLYADSFPIYEYWEPEFVYAYIKQDMKELEKVLKTKVIRLKTYEVYEIRNKYAINFYYLIAILIKGLAVKVFDMPEFIVMSKESQVKVLFGKYMEKQVELCIWGADE